MLGGEPLSAESPLTTPIPRGPLGESPPASFCIVGVAQARGMGGEGDALPGDPSKEGLLQAPDCLPSDQHSPP